MKPNDQEIYEFLSKTEGVKDLVYVDDKHLSTIADPTELRPRGHKPSVV